MVVRLAKDALRLVILVAHAPACPTFLEAQAFWNALSQAIPASLRSWSTIAFLDANARVGSQTSDCIGSFGAEEENLAGECFHAWLVDRAMMVPQTMSDHHRGSHTTWAHSLGHEARLGYIAIDQHLCSPALTTCLANVDLTIKKRDHSRVLMELPLHCQFAQRDDFRLQELPAPLDAPHIPWATDVHTHAAQLQAWMQSHRPPRRQMLPRERHLTPATWNLIRCKRFHWNRLRHLKTTLRRSILREVFTIWQKRRPSTEPDGLRPWMRLIDRVFVFKYLKDSRRMTRIFMTSLLLNKATCGGTSNLFFPSPLLSASPTFAALDLVWMS